MRIYIIKHVFAAATATAAAAAYVSLLRKQYLRAVISFNIVILLLPRSGARSRMVLCL